MQDRHVELLVAPTVEEYVPSWHSAHWLALYLYVPAKHAPAAEAYSLQPLMLRVETDVPIILLTTMANSLYATAVLVLSGEVCT